MEKLQKGSKKSETPTNLFIMASVFAGSVMRFTFYFKNTWTISPINVVLKHCPLEMLSKRLDHSRTRTLILLSLIKPLKVVSANHL